MCQKSYFICILSNICLRNSLLIQNIKIRWRKNSDEHLFKTHSFFFYFTNKVVNLVIYLFQMHLLEGWPPFVNQEYGISLRDGGLTTHNHITIHYMSIDKSQKPKAKHMVAEIYRNNSLNVFPPIFPLCSGVFGHDSFLRYHKIWLTMKVYEMDTAFNHQRNLLPRTLE